MPGTHSEQAVARAINSSIDENRTFEIHDTLDNPLCADICTDLRARCEDFEKLEPEYPTDERTVYQFYGFEFGEAWTVRIIIHPAETDLAEIDAQTASYDAQMEEAERELARRLDAQEDERDEYF